VGKIIPIKAKRIHYRKFDKSADSLRIATTDACGPREACRKRPRRRPAEWPKPVGSTRLAIRG
jgi:hypothetical protein